MIRSFADKHAVVTGAASGIGLALAKELVARHCHVALVDKSPDVNTVSAELRATGVRVSTHVADVSVPADWRRIVSEIEAVHGKAQLLINNAGVSISGRFEDVNQSDMEWLFGVNYWGVVHGCREFLPMLKAQPEAHIVNVCSSFAWLGVSGKSAYASSKAAVRAFSESLRAELTDTSVGVTLLFPGAVATQIVRNGRSISESQKNAEDHFLRSRSGSPERMAKRCLDGVLKNKPRVLVGLDYHVMDLVLRLSPNAAQALITTMTKKLPF